MLFALKWKVYIYLFCKYHADEGFGQWDIVSAIIKDLLFQGFSAEHSMPIGPIRLVGKIHAEGYNRVTKSAWGKEEGH